VVQFDVKFIKGDQLWIDVELFLIISRKGLKKYMAIFYFEDEFNVMIEVNVLIF